MQRLFPCANRWRRYSDWSGCSATYTRSDETDREDPSAYANWTPVPSETARKIFSPPRDPDPDLLFLLPFFFSFPEPPPFPSTGISVSGAGRARASRIVLITCSFSTTSSRKWSVVARRKHGDRACHSISYSPWFLPMHTRIIVVNIHLLACRLLPLLCGVCVWVFFLEDECRKSLIVSLIVSVGCW